MNDPIIYNYGDKYCYDEKGQFHREDGPALEYFDGTKIWYFHGKWIDCSTQEEFLKIIKLRMFW